MKKRYTLVGVGSRGFGMFARPLVEGFFDVAALVGLCDHNQQRMDLANHRLGTDIPTYTDFQEMLAATQPDTVIVCTVDGTHHRFILEALEAGCDVITEKPMTTTAARVRAILAAEERSGGTVRVSFNARYGAPAETIYKLLREGAIGEILSADFTEFLNTSHGADYFRRWHRRKENSGGLLVHKATHHFDQLNWWLDAEPQTVFAMGSRRFYGPTREERGERCLTCSHTDTCPFYLDLRANDKLRAFYLEAEDEDGYYRDRCVFDEEIDIEDTLVVNVRYANDVLVNYALTAYAPYEGQRIGFNGTEGRLEVDLVDAYHRRNDEGVLEVQPMDVPRAIKVNPLFEQPHDVPIAARGEGGHGGADARLREHLFREDVLDPLHQVAGSRAGALSALIGVAANRSIETGQPVEIGELLG
ncbi:MAG: Gfo/Idh/MocA family oxidoreductase [Anaerolineae bacterium]